MSLLWEEYLGAAGKPRAELLERLATQPTFSSPAGKRRMVCHLLLKIFRTEIVAAVKPRVLRGRLFVAAASRRLERAEVCQQVAEEFGIREEELETALYADLPSEKCLSSPKQEIPVGELALRTNLALVQGLLARARSVEVEFFGNSHAVVRLAKRKGLLCVVKPGEGSRIRLEVSGPFSLFRCTLVYGRALGEIIPILSWCNDFELKAAVVLGDKSHDLRLRRDAPIFPAEPPKLFDSKLERHFARAFRQAARSWALIREPEPVVAGETMIFPDFAVEHREDSSKRWLLEIVGSWTPDYLRKKLEHLNKAEMKNLILCVNRELNCTESDFPHHAQVIFYSKRIDPQQVLKCLEC